MKPKEKARTGKDSIDIPLNVLMDREVAVLEAIVEYLKENKKLTYHEIAVLTNRNDRTIWTVYNRVKKKREKLKEKLNLAK